MRAGPNPGRLAADNYKQMNDLSKDAVNWLVVGEEAQGQRIDNFLVRILKGVPKSHIYRILRSGEVRVNRRKVGPDARLAAGDKLRVPPIRATVLSRDVEIGSPVSSILNLGSAATLVMVLGDTKKVYVKGKMALHIKTQIFFRNSRE